MHLGQGFSGGLLHLHLLNRQLSQLLILRLRVRFPLTAQFDSDPDENSLVSSMAVDEELKMKIDENET